MRSEGSCDLQRDRSGGVPEDRGHDALAKYGVDADGAVCAVRRADHAAEGRDAPGRGDSLSAAGDAGGVVRGAPDTPEIAAEMREKVEAGAGLRIRNMVWIEKMVTKQEAIQLY